MGNYILEDVSYNDSLWSDSDPVRPDISADFKTSPGRGVFGLRSPDGAWKAFMCYARTCDVPSDISEIETYTDEAGNFCIPYSVWSKEKGAGRAIINEVLRFINSKDNGIGRVVTLSPLTDMARKFHLRNGAFEFRMNETSVNFEYRLED